MIALLGFPAKPPKALNYMYNTYDLIYIDKEGKQVLLNQKEVLDALARHKEQARFVPGAIEKGEEAAIAELASALKKWLEAQATAEEIRADGTVKPRAGSETKDLLSKLKTGDSAALSRVKQNISMSAQYQPPNVDLITWFLVN